MQDTPINQTLSRDTIIYKLKKTTNRRQHFNKKEIILTKGYVFQTMQLTRNLPKNDKQHILGAIA